MVVDRVVVDVVVALPDPAPEDPSRRSTWWCRRRRRAAGLVVVVVADAGGATNGMVSPRMVVRLVEGPADRLVQPRAAFQLWTAAAAGRAGQWLGQAGQDGGGAPDGTR